MKMCVDVYDRVGTSHSKVFLDVHTKVGTTRMKVCSCAFTKAGTPYTYTARWGRRTYFFDGKNNCGGDTAQY